MIWYQAMLLMLVVLALIHIPCSSNSFSGVKGLVRIPVPIVSYGDGYLNSAFQVSLGNVLGQEKGLKKLLIQGNKQAKKPNNNPLFHCTFSLLNHFSSHQQHIAEYTSAHAICTTLQSIPLHRPFVKLQDLSYRSPNNNLQPAHLLHSLLSTDDIFPCPDALHKSPFERRSWAACSTEG